MDGLYAFVKGLDNNLVTLVSIIGSTSFLTVLILTWLRKQLDAIFVQLAKNYLIRTFGEIEEGKKISDIEMMGMKDIYGAYIKKGGNTFVQDKYELLKKQGLI